MIELTGTIEHRGAANAEKMLEALQTAYKEKNVAGVIVRINSPGGSPVQAGIINDEIRRLKRKHDKKVYAVVEEACASGAYYVAVAADLIYVDKASIVGSIGVLMDGFGFTGTMEKFGVERRLITAGDNKGMLDPFSPVNEKQRELAQAMIDQVHRQFIAVVREGRGQRLKESPETFSGLFWNGEEAIKLGLADGLGNLDFVHRSRRCQSPSWHGRPALNHAAVSAPNRLLPARAVGRIDCTRNHERSPFICHRAADPPPVDEPAEAA